MVKPAPAVVVIIPLLAAVGIVGKVAYPGLNVAAVVAAWYPGVVRLPTDPNATADGVVRDPAE